MAFGLAKAIERQLGAHDLDLNTFEGETSFTWYPPTTIDLDAIDDALESASYELRSATVVASGEVVVEGGKTHLKLATGQLLPLRGWSAGEGAAEVTAELAGWTEGAASLVVGSP